MGRTNRAPWLHVSTYMDVISGRRRGLTASLLRGVLWILEAPYALAVRWRTWRFDTGRRLARRVGVPVISVGNLTTGGTGKTPLVSWIAQTLERIRTDRTPVRIVLISRGYGAKPGAVNDEAMELEQQLPGIPHLQNPDRVAAAKEAIDRLSASILLLDDAFQHRRIHRDLDIVLLDALEPWGHGHLLPRGLLREPIAGLGRAQAIGLSRADLIDAEQREGIRKRAERLSPHAIWFEICHRPRFLVDTTGATTALPSGVEVPVLAFCGLGNPQGFQRSLEQAGYQLLDFQAFPDHHPYDGSDLKQLAEWSSQFPAAEQILCTRKDLVKLNRTTIGALPLRALAIEVEFLRGESEVVARLAELTVRGMGAPRPEGTSSESRKP